MAKVFACVSDLMLASRVSESLKAGGHEVRVGASLPENLDADLVVCDLDGGDIDAIAALAVPSIGFYSHVDVETRDRAKRAGIDLVVPRSRMARELPDLVARFV